MDVVTYCKDTDLLVAEIAEKFPNRLNNENPNSPKFVIQKSPTVRNGNETLALVRVTVKSLAILNKLENLQVLGTYADIFSDADKLEIYNRIYPQSIIKVPDPADPENSQVDYFEDRRFAVFA